MNEEIKVGDRVLVCNIFGGIYHAYIIKITQGFFGKRYYGRWTVNSDYMGKYETAGRVPSWRIIGKH